MAVIVKKETNENESLSSTQITYRLPSSGAAKKSPIQTKTTTIESPENSRLKMELIKTFLVSLVIFAILAVLFLTLR